MTYLIILVILLALISMGLSYLRIYKESLFNALDLVYDKMELSIVQYNVELDNSVKRYLTGFKSYLVKREMADIRVMLAIKKLIPATEWEELIKANDKLKSKLPEPILELEAEFGKIIQKLITISIFTTDFLFYLTIAALKKFLRTSKINLHPVDYIRVRIENLTTSENIIGSNTSRLDTNMLAAA